MKTLAKLIGLGFVFAGAFFVASVVAHWPESGRTAAQPVVDTTIAQMVEHCDNNEVAFESYWRGKSARVLGIVASIDSGIAGGVLRFDGGSRIRSVSAYDLPEDFLAALQKGQSVRVTCDRITESMGGPHLSGCRP